MYLLPRGIVRPIDCQQSYQITSGLLGPAVTQITWNSLTQNISVISYHSYLLLNSVSIYPMQRINTLLFIKSEQLSFTSLNFNVLHQGSNTKKIIMPPYINTTTLMHTQNIFNSCRPLANLGMCVGGLHEC